MLILGTVKPETKWIMPEADQTVNTVRGTDARKSVLHLVVGFAFDETARVTTHVPSTDFIVDPDQ